MASTHLRTCWRLHRLLRPRPLLGSRSMSTEVSPTTDDTEAKKKSPKVSIAMQYYLDKKRQHDAFIAAERSEFELGRKHLANMMGMDAMEMSQEDIDKAIEYLFPAGLHTATANPMMKPPEMIFPRQKDAEFDESGRPFSPFFYTGQANYVEALHNLVQVLEDCILLTEKLLAKGQKPDENKVLDDVALTGTRWMTKDELANLLFDTVLDNQYEEFISVLERLVQLPFAYQAKNTIFKYRLDSGQAKSKVEFQQPEFDDQGRAFVQAMGQRLTACAKVKVIKPGTGKFTLTHIDYPDNSYDITYFYGLKERQQIMYPLQFTKLMGQVDVEAIVYGGGASGQSGAIRYALSLCLRSFVDEDTIEDMNVCGLLTQDIRVHERTKPGKVGPRQRPKWRKR